MQNQQIKIQKQYQQNKHQQYKDVVITEYLESYHQILNSYQNNHQLLSEIFAKHNILYLPNSPYKKYQFKVQRIIPNFNFYRILVSISHFTLTLNVMCANYPFPQTASQQVQSSFGKIYFYQHIQKKLCIKSFPFTKQNNFQYLLVRVIKEWSILKICSAIKCGPFIENNMGFDLLIFNDCIQFVTEKGHLDTQITDILIKKLKSDLSLMHSLKIVHLDIKKENIIFSPHFGKFVFIDFGFSEILKQKCGQKTWSSFKGTINFCTKEMMNLFGGNYGFIDLYYNDAYGLKLLLNNNYEINNEQQQLNYELYDLKINEIYYNNFQNYLIYTFQYYYLNKQQYKLIKLIYYDFKNDINNIKIILKFIKSIYQYLFNHHIFKKYLSTYQYLIQYQDIQNYIHNHNHLLIGKILISTSSKENQENQENIKSIQLQSYSQENEFIQQSNYLIEQNAILELQKLQPETAIYFVAAIFRCIRFDQNGIDLVDKLNIAIKSNYLLSQYMKIQIKKQYQDELSPIRQILEYIFEFCLNFAPNQWVREHIFDIFEQIILLDCNYLTYIDRMIEYLNQNFKSYIDKLEITFELSRLMQLTFHILSCDFSKNLQSNKKFNNLISNYLEELQNQTISDIQIKSIKLVINDLLSKNPNKKSDLHVQNILNNIQNQRLKKFIIYFSTQKRIQKYFDQSNIQKLYLQKQFIKKSLKIRSMGLFMSSNLILKLMQRISDNCSSNQYCKYIASVINCKAVFDLYCPKGIISKLSQKYEKHSQILQKFIEIYPYLCQISQMADYDLLDILLKIQREVQYYNNDLIIMLLKVYKIYEQSKNNKKIASQNKVLYFYQIYYRSKVSFYFYKLSQQTKQLFIQQMNNAYQQEQKLKIFQQQNSLKMLFGRFKSGIYKYKYYFLQKRYKQAILIIQQMIQLCLKLNLLQLSLNLCMSIHLISKTSQKQDIIIQNGISCYLFCKQINHLTFYLYPNSKSILFKTMSILARYSSSQLINLLIYLTQLISKNPIQNYFIRIVQEINYFLKRDTTFSSLIHYLKFIQNNKVNLKSNPYILIFYVYSLQGQNHINRIQLLKIIAINLDMLALFARRYLLQRYYSIFINTFLDQFPRLCTFILKRYKRYFLKKDFHLFMRDQIRIFKQRLINCIFKKKIIQKYIKLDKNNSIKLSK